MQLLARKALMPALAGLIFSTPTLAGAFQGNDGSMVLLMCQGADKVRSLSVMCHSYLNGYLDAARHYGKGKMPFCLEEGDKERLPTAVVYWISAHPDSRKQPAGQVVDQVLSERFPCKGRK